jgi:hypothetical protein
MGGTGGTPGGPPASPDDINSRLADIAAELASQALFKEPSAEERARVPVQPVRPAVRRRRGPLRKWQDARVAARLRSPVATPGRGQGAQWPPAESRRRKAQPLGGGRPARPGSVRTALAVVTVVVALLAAAFGVSRLLKAGPSSSPATKPTPTASTPSAATPTAADPWAGTAAQTYMDNAAGIVPPSAHPVGPFSAADVAAAYQRVKRLLIAADLDQPTLAGGKPTAFASLLIAPERRWFYANLNKTGLAKKSGIANSSRVWVTSFVPGSVVFVTSTVKVAGLPMTASVLKYQGRTVLSIFAHYEFVYAVEQPGVAGTLLRVVTQTWDTVYFAQWTDPGGALQPWVADINTSHAGALCGFTDGFVHPQFPVPGHPGTAPSGLPKNPYSLNGPPVKSGTCAASTGT